MNNNNRPSDLVGQCIEGQRNLFLPDLNESTPWKISLPPASLSVEW